MSEAKAGGAVSTYTIIGTVDADGNAQAVGPSGALPVERASGQTILHAVVSESSSGNNEVVAAAGSGLKIKVVSYVIIAAGAVSAKWRTASTDLSGAMALAANGGVSASSDETASLLVTAANEALNLNLSGAVAVAGHVSYYVEA